MSWRAEDLGGRLTACIVFSSGARGSNVVPLIAAANSSLTRSFNLKVLREGGLVDSERRGTWVYYRARPESLKQLSVLLDSPALAPT